MTISSMRKYIKGSGSSFIVWLLIFSFVGALVLQNLYQFAFQKKGSNSVVVVNGLEVTPIDYRRVYLPLANTIKELKRQFGEQAQALLQFWGIANQSPEQIALDKVIQDKIIQSVSDDLNVEVSREFVEQKLQDQLFVRQVLGDLLPEQLFVNNSLDPQMLSLYLERQGISESDFEQLLVQKFKQNLFEMLVYDSAYVSQDQIKKEYLSQFAKKKYSVVPLNLDSYLSKVKKEQATDKQLEEFYQANRENYRVPEQRAANRWQFTPENYAIAVKEPEILKYYNQNKSEFIDKPAKYKVKRIIFKADKANDSLKIQAQARKLAQDLKEQPDEFDKKAAELGKAESVEVKTSDESNLPRTIVQQVKNLSLNSPIAATKSDEGYEVIKLIDKQDPVYKPLSEVKNEIKKTLELNKFNTQFSSDATRVINQAQDNSAILTKFVESKKAKADSINLHKNDNSLAAQKLFSLTKDKTRGFYQQEGKGFILQLDNIKPSAIKPFEQVKDEVKKDYYLDRAKKSLEQDLAKGKNLMSLEPKKAAQGLNSKVTTTDWINPEEKATQESLRKLGVEVPQILKLDRKNQVVTQLVDDKGFIVRLDEIESITPEQIKKKEVQLRQKAKAQESQDIFHSLIAWLNANAKIDVNKQMLKFASRA